jgi:hypothetical protein
MRLPRRTVNIGVKVTSNKVGFYDSSQLTNRKSLLGSIFSSIIFHSLTAFHSAATLHTTISFCSAAALRSATALFHQQRQLSARRWLSTRRRLSTRRQPSLAFGLPYGSLIFDTSECGYCLAPRSRRAATLLLANITLFSHNLWCGGYTSCGFFVRCVVVWLCGCYVFEFLGFRVSGVQALAFQNFHNVTIWLL